MDRILFRRGTPEPMRRDDTPYLYQTVHVLHRRPLYLDRHAALLDSAARELFDLDFTPDLGALSTQIGTLLDANRYPETVSSFVRIELTAGNELRLVPGAVSLYAGYALRSLRPTAIIRNYNLPHSEYPTSAREALLLLTLEQIRHTGAVAVIRCDETDLVRTGDDAPLFAVKGNRIYTPPAPQSVERELALRTIATAHLSVIEQEIERGQLRLFDELFYFDHRGITSLSGCEETPYTEIITNRIAQKINTLL